MSLAGNVPSGALPGANTVFRCRDRTLLFTGWPVIMGIINVTPDSFSDGGCFFDTDRAVERALQMIEEGAEIIDIGGESSRPGAAPVPEEEEKRRVLPVIRSLAEAAPNVLISVDTVKAGVAESALEAGAHIVNDISGLHRDPRMADVVRDAAAGLVVMHMRGTPATMQQLTAYDDLVGEICDYFRRTMEEAAARGISPEQIVLDPGIGFSKTPEQNYILIAATPRFRALGRPILLGPSRKSFIARLFPDLAPPQRVWGTAAAVVCGVLGGADIFRVHDVAAMRQAALTAAALRDAAAHAGVVLPFPVDAHGRTERSSTRGADCEWTGTTH